MHYNLRVFEYPNGEIQVRYYTTPLYKNDNIPLEKEEIFDKQSVECLFDEKRIYEPWNGDRVKEISCNIADLDKLEFISKVKSNNRTKQSIYSYARCVKWDWFLTFTIDENKKDRFDYEICSKAVRKWFDNQRQRFAPDLKYLVVPEQHKNGAWHFHGLLANCGKMKFSYSGHSDSSKNKIYNLDNYKLGFTTATRVSDYHKVAKYIGKYISKDMCGLTKGKQRYFVSKNLEKPKISNFFLVKGEEDLREFIIELADSCGVEFVHVSSKGAKDSYTKVKYFEFQ